MTLTRGQKAAATRKRNYGKRASREHIDAMLKQLPNVTEQELMVDLRFYEYLVAYRDMLARDAGRTSGQEEERARYEELKSGDLSGAREGDSSGQQRRFCASVKALSNASRRIECDAFRDRRIRVY